MVRAAGAGGAQAPVRAGQRHRRAPALPLPCRGRRAPKRRPDVRTRRRSRRRRQSRSPRRRDDSSWCRSHRQAHVDEAAAAWVEPVGSADPRQDFAGPVIGDDQGSADPGADALRPLGRQRLEPHLQPSIERRRDLACAQPRRDQAVCEMRCQPPGTAAARSGRARPGPRRPPPGRARRPRPRAPGPGRAPSVPLPARGQAGAFSGDYGRATSRAASAADSRHGSLPSQARLAARKPL